MRRWKIKNKNKNYDRDRKKNHFRTPFIETEQRVARLDIGIGRQRASASVLVKPLEGLKIICS